MLNFLRYFFASLTALLLDYAVTSLGLWLAWPYYVALAAGVLAGAALGFLLFTYWVFPSRSRSFSPRRLLGYVSGLGLVYAVRTLIMWYIMHHSNWKVDVGLVLAYGSSFMCNFLYQKYLVFTHSHKQSSKCE